MTQRDPDVTQAREISRQYDMGQFSQGGGAGRRAGGRGPGSVLEGLPVDGTCSVLLVLPLRHPHLLEGVQRRQNGAAAEMTRAFVLFSFVTSCVTRILSN